MAAEVISVDDADGSVPVSRTLRRRLVKPKSATGTSANKSPVTVGHGKPGRSFAGGGEVNPCGGRTAVWSSMRSRGVH